MIEILFLTIISSFFKGEAIEIILEAEFLHSNTETSLVRARNKDSSE